MARTILAGSPWIANDRSETARRTAPAGVWSYAASGGGLTSPWPKPVRAGPGSTRVKAIPNGAASCATDSTKPSIAHLLACYRLKSE